MFFQQVLVNPDTDEHGKIILPGGSIPEGDSADREPTSNAAQEPTGWAEGEDAGDACGGGAASSEEDGADQESTGRDPGKVAGAAGRVNSGDAECSETPTAATDAPQTEPPARPPLLIRGSSSRTSAAGCLAWPFDQLTSPGLRHVAQQYAQAVTSDDGACSRRSRTDVRVGTDGPGSPHHSQEGLRHPRDLGTGGPESPGRSHTSSAASSQRKTPTSEGEHASLPETAPDTISHGACSYRSVVVREKGLEPSRPKAPGPKPGASTNSATRACGTTLPRLRRAPGPPEDAGPPASPRTPGRPLPGARPSVDAELGAQAPHVPGGLDVVLGQGHRAVGSHHDG